MSTTTTTTTATFSVVPRKRTTSFCVPSEYARPTKAQRTNMGSSLRRTESYITFADIKTSSQSQSQRKAPIPAPVVPYKQSLQYQKDQRDARRRGLHSQTQTNRSVEPTTIRIRTDAHPVTRPPFQQILPSANSKPTPHRPTTPTLRKPKPLHALPSVFTPPRQSSPLAPTRAFRPSRPVFPRSKPEPDLYRKALRACMKGTPEGRKMLKMGPRLAMQIEKATQDLEMIIAQQVEREKEREREEDLDVVMADAQPVWVVVGAGEDWETVDCEASST
ncbi:hypothetical protein Hypma_006385 [Hypsizygus marmoreus]|uniref:Uncharacterized protein n=1 Tax=Hypsizygus marmoreus TaxID=39966 RepID=A0A369JYE2_HYPMA|nr:hypothetical protein Hypma_006385 [Hypsizygus marmoreus]